MVGVHWKYTLQYVWTEGIALNEKAKSKISNQIIFMPFCGSDFQIKVSKHLQFQLHNEFVVMSYGMAHVSNIPLKNSTSLASRQSFYLIQVLVVPGTHQGLCKFFEKINEGMMKACCNYISMFYFLCEGDKKFPNYIQLTW